MYRRRGGARPPPKTSLLVVKLTRGEAGGEPRLGLSAPCSICTQVLKAANVTRVYYSTASGAIKMVRTTDLPPGVPSNGLIRVIKLIEPTDVLLTKVLSPHTVKLARSTRSGKG